MFLIRVIRRAFASNLRTISVSHDEQAKLVALGIHDPTIQRFLVWRRSIVAVVVLATFLSAGLTTYLEFTETEDRPDFVEAVTEQLLEGAKKAVPAAGLVLPADREMEDDEDGPDEDEPTAKQSSTDVKSATASKSKESDRTKALGQIADGVHLFSLYALPLAALAVACCWTRLKLSFQFLLVGFLIAFFVPMLVALCPWSWWGEPEQMVTFDQDPALYLQLLLEGLLEGAQQMVVLLPTVLSLVPGVQRACLRVKTLVPESMLPGWFLVAAAPFYALFLLVIFIAINQITSEPLLLISMLLLAGAPFIYVFRADVFTRPLMTEADYLRMRRVQQVVSGATALAGLLLVVYLAPQQYFDIHLVGLDVKTSLLGPLDLIGFFLELIGRSLFMTVLGADLFMRMNLSTWQHHRTLAGSSAAEGYDRVMGAMEQISE